MRTALQIQKIVKSTPHCVTHSKSFKKINVLRGGDLDPINYLLFFFFSKGTETNPAILLVLYAVCIFLSLPTGNSNAFVSRRVHSFFNFVAIFHKYISLSKDVGHYLKPINNLLILSFLSLSNHFGRQKNIGLRMNLFRQQCRLTSGLKPSAINFNRSQKVPRKLKREVFGYS